MRRLNAAPRSSAAALAAVAIAVGQAALFGAVGVAAQSAAGATQPPVPSARIDSVFLDLDRTSSPGCAVGVVRDGALVFADGYGSANLDHEIAITPETVFYMGSVSKQFTAGAVLLAARQGHLSLDDDVRTWIPELPDYGPTVTVRHLVHHTSGIRDYLTLQSIAGSYGGVTDDEVVALLARQKALNFAPGERYLYSNSGYFLLSEILERATGLSLREFGERHFFRPLGMRYSHFHDRADHIVRNRATGYAPTDSGFRMEHAWDFAQVGSGGLYSNVVDMARWEVAFEAGEVGDEGFTEAMLQRGVLDDGDTLSYAFGLGIDTYRGLRTIAHGGSLAGFRSYVIRFPDHATSVLVFCNVTDADPGGRARQVAELVLGDRMGPEQADRAEADEPEEGDEGPEPPTLSADRVAEYAGRYYSEEVDAELTLRVDDGSLTLERADELARLRVLEDDTFALDGLRFRFTRDHTGAVTGFVMDAGRANGMIFERVEGR